ncbi:MAG: NAD(P)H-dependent glycerol-3-phosphate dehydrogenase [Erysipelotrichaceae bacterium]
MKISVLGSGSFGTALAQVLIRNNHEVILWGKEVSDVEEINLKHQNTKYFPDVYLDERLTATSDLSEIEGSEIILLAIPSIAIEEVCQLMVNYIHQAVIVVNVAKGFHPVSYKRLSEVIEDVMDPKYLRDVVSLIGPSHAEEVVEGLLTVVNAVSKNDESAKIVQDAFSNSYFRVYRNTDVVGAEIGVALKNIIALASGVLSGLGQGDNARAALMTRGLAEIVRYGTHFGGNLETYLGLTGVGDLIVTCTSVHSRNFQAGYQIGKANDAKEFLKNNQKTVEGIRSAEIVYHVAKEKGISMPIVNEVYATLFENKKPSDAILDLMGRELKKED